MIWNGGFNLEGDTRVSRRLIRRLGLILQGDTRVSRRLIPRLGIRNIRSMNEPCHIYELVLVSITGITDVSH